MNNIRKVKNKNEQDIDEYIHSIYTDDSIYKVETICRKYNKESKEYVERLLSDKLDLVRRVFQQGVMVDLCCGTGEHLFELQDLSSQCIGIDFCEPYIEEARKRAKQCGLDNISLDVGDAKNLAIESGSIATLYCFSALYAISKQEEVIAEISRVLEPGGVCVLDMGNSKSINSYCLKYYGELPPSFRIPVSEMKEIICQNNLRIIHHRAFQLLPLWAGKPGWLKPLLHPVWKKIMSTRIREKMLDEWLSSLPLVKIYAFRHLFVCEKI